MQVRYQAALRPELVMISKIANFCSMGALPLVFSNTCFASGKNCHPHTSDGARRENAVHFHFPPRPHASALPGCATPRVGNDIKDCEFLQHGLRAGAFWCVSNTCLNSSSICIQICNNLGLSNGQICGKFNFFKLLKT
jgi:hypothetical protein